MKKHQEREKNAHRSIKVRGEEITGQESMQELFEKAFTGFVGREVKTAFNIIKEMIENDYTIVWTLAGAMTPIDLGRSCLVPLMKKGMIDILVTTGANLYHDLQRLESDEWYEVSPLTDDECLEKQGLARIYDTVFPDRSLWETDRLVRRLILQKEFNRPMTTTEFHYLLTEKVEEEIASDGWRGQRKLENGSLLIQAKKFGIPIFCGAVQDGSIYLNLALVKRLKQEEYKFSIDLETDIFEFAAYHYFAKNRWSKKLGIVILGGGVPKNYALQPEPFLSQICKIPVGGYDRDVQICDSHVQNGGLSSCTASEAHTWGKTSRECVKHSQYVFADITVVFPLITKALLERFPNGRNWRRIYNLRQEAMDLLDKKLKKKS